ncbi:transposase [Actinoallomurus purpureus]|nr:transposase [Actinoallomurus purpureus]
MNLHPRPGHAWRSSGHPARLRATYNRRGGVRHMLAALDLASGKMIYRIRARKRSGEFLSFLKILRARRPGEKLYLICDNFSPHKHSDVTCRAADNDIELVFLPTYASWLNWIEAEFAALRYFALSEGDFEQGNCVLMLPRGMRVAVADHVVRLPLAEILAGNLNVRLERLHLIERVGHQFAVLAARDDVRASRGHGV